MPENTDIAIEPIAPEPKRGKWKYVILSIGLVLMPLSALSLFAVVLFQINDSWGGLPIPYWIVLFLLLIVVALPTILTLLAVLEHFRRQKEHPSEKLSMELLEYGVHAVPYAILALTMLFEYDKVRTRAADGIPAVSSIMILFLLAEFALVVFQGIRKAEQVSRGLDETLRDVGSKLRALPWLDHYIKLSKPGEEDDMATSLGKLLGFYAGLVDDSKGRPSQLTRRFLSDYFREELADIQAEMSPDSIPDALRPPSLGRASYFATNVGFYAKFLQDAIYTLSHTVRPRGQRASEPKDQPCIAVITNALPSQFWIWVDEGRKGGAYAPIVEYRRAQFEGADKYALKVFRTILVAESSSSVLAANVPLQRSDEIPALWTLAEWKRQMAWVLLLPLNGPDEPIAWNQTPVGDLAHLVPHLKWVLQPGQDGEREKACSMLDAAPSLSPSSTLKYERVWDFYCRKLHMESRNLGFTEICSVSAPQFIAAPPEGMQGCPDIMFLGTCPIDTTDIWDDAAQPNWELVIMTTMSAQTKTMFLSLVHDRVTVNQWWNIFRKARSRFKQEDRS